MVGLLPLVDSSFWQYRRASRDQAPGHDKDSAQVLNVSLRTTKKLFTSKLNIKKTIREAKDASREVYSTLLMGIKDKSQVTLQEVQIRYTELCITTQWGKYLQNIRSKA